jgi:hypothetical protein
MRPPRWLRVERAAGLAPDATTGRGHLVVLPLAALVAVLPLIVHGCSCGHDFDFHLLSWMEAANQFTHGNLRPHWAFTPAFNAGEPRFVFYPPLSWTLGALLGLLLTHLPDVSEATGWTTAPIVFTWIALTLSGLTMHRLARAYAGANAALFAATLYLANPYMLFTAYERTAYAELLAAAWMPLLLSAILRPSTGKDCITIAGIAVPVALLWLTNAPAAVMGCYTLALLAVVCIAANSNAPTFQPKAQGPSRIALALKVVSGTAVGLGLASFYIVPAEYERRFVQIAMATITGMRIDENFLFEHTGITPDELLHDQVLHTASLLAIILLTATFAALAAVYLHRKRAASSLSDSLPSFPIGPLALLTAAIAFLLTPLSASIWRHAPEAAFLQFPWRLLAVLAPVLALAVAAALTCAGTAPSNIDPSSLAEDRDLSRTWQPLRGSLAVPAIALLLAAALALPAYHLFRQPCDPEDTAPARLALFHSSAGTDPTDEYTPIAADNDALQPGDPPYWLADSPSAAAPATSHPGLAPMHFVLTSRHAGFLILNLRDFPAWRIVRNGVLVQARSQRNDGLIAVPVPAGAFSIDIHYAHTPDQFAGDAFTLLALLLLFFCG